MFTGVTMTKKNSANQTYNNVFGYLEHTLITKLQISSNIINVLVLTDSLFH